MAADGLESLPWHHWYTSARARWEDYLELSKARLTGMVVITTGVGFIMASSFGIQWQRLFWTCFGTFLLGAGASAFNQAWEKNLDAKMKRTSDRPVAAGRISVQHAIWFGLIVSLIGLAILCPLSCAWAAVLGLANLLIYVLIYTPLKTRSTLNTLVGAVCGAIPPMMGWVAGSPEHTFATGAWILGGILFVWQIPHFLALAVMYKDEYARGGYRMLPNVDVTGHRTVQMMLIYSLALLPLCLELSYSGVTGMVFLTGSVILGMGMLVLAIRYAVDRERSSARAVFLGSIAYLPAIMILMVLDRYPMG